MNIEYNDYIKAVLEIDVDREVLEMILEQPGEKVGEVPIKKKIVMVLVVWVIALTLAILTFAAPKQMADGNMFDAEYYAVSNPDVVAVFI